MRKLIKKIVLENENLIGKQKCFFFRGFAGFLGAPALYSTNDCFYIVFGPLLSLICRTKGMQRFFYIIFLLLLFPSGDIKYFALKSKQTRMLIFSFSYRK